MGRLIVIGETFRSGVRWSNSRTVRTPRVAAGWIGFYWGTAGRTIVLKECRPTDVVVAGILKRTVRSGARHPAATAPGRSSRRQEALEFCAIAPRIRRFRDSRPRPLGCSRRRKSALILIFQNHSLTRRRTSKSQRRRMGIRDPLVRAGLQQRCMGWGRLPDVSPPGERGSKQTENAMRNSNPYPDRWTAARRETLPHDTGRLAGKPATLGSHDGTGHAGAVCRYAART